MLWEGDGHTSPNFSQRESMYNVSGVPHTVFNGTETVVGGGTNMYPYYLDVYNQLIYDESPIHINFVGYIHGDGGVDLVADIVLTEDMQPGGNIKLIFILTYWFSNNYWCTVQRYYEEPFDLTHYGESGTYEHYFDLEPGWNISNVSGVVMVQNLSGNHKIYQSSITNEFEDPIIHIPFMYDNGWATVGLPIIASNTNYQYIFPDAIDNTLYSFDGGYNLETNLVNGEGYWIRFGQEGYTNFVGYELEVVTIPLVEGWNMISGVSEVTQVHSLSDPYGLVIQNTIYIFDNGYYLVDEFEPGHGYWLRSSGEGNIVISIYDTSNNLNPLRVDDLSSTHTIRFNDYPLYFGGSITTDNLLSYSLPPTPPGGAFDVRFSDDTRYSKNGGSISIRGIDKLKVSYDIQNNEEWKLMIGNKVYTLKEKNDIDKIEFNSLVRNINLIRSTTKTESK